MLLSVLHTTSGVIIILLLAGKIIIHYFLNRSRGNTGGFNSIAVMPLQYLLPYKFAVSPRYKKMKYCCNLLLLLAVLALIANIIFGLLIYFT